MVRVEVRPCQGQAMIAFLSEGDQGDLLCSGTGIVGWLVALPRRTPWKGVPTSRLDGMIGMGTSVPMGRLRHLYDGGSSPNLGSVLFAIRCRFIQHGRQILLISRKVEAFFVAFTEFLELLHSEGFACCLAFFLQGELEIPR